MRHRTILAALALIALGWGLGQTASNDAPEDVFRKEEYVTIRWDGRDHTHVVRANRRSDSFRGVFSELRRPKDTDERTFYMNVAMNSLAREGYVFAGMSEDSIVMKRALR